MTYDICVIGAGSGGLTTAAFAASLGAKVILIEKHKMGGDCLNYGCVPSKALIHAAKIGMDFSQAMAHVRAAIATIEPNDSISRFEGLGVEIVIGEAKFTSKNAVKVNDREITARKFVIATGSRAKTLSTLTDYLTNETIFDLETLPKTLAVYGAGPIGIELAQAFAGLGSKVTLFTKGRILPRESQQAALLLLENLQKQGIQMNIAGEFEKTLVAIGRTPNLDLDLEKAGVLVNETGIIVDFSLKTSNAQIYAIGDVVGGGFTHAAGFHGSLVAQNILFKRPINHLKSPMPRCTFSNPEIAVVGETTGLRTLYASFSHNDRAITDEKTSGFIKIFVNTKGKIKGAEIVSASASELISLYSLAIKNDLAIGDIAATIMPYPTLSEVGKRAAGDYYKASAQNPWVRRIVSILKRF